MYGAIAHFGKGFQCSQKLFWSTRIQGHELYLVFTGLSHSGKYQIRGKKLSQLDISTGLWKILHQADMGPYTIWHGKINGVTVKFGTSHYSSLPVPYFYKY